MNTARELIAARHPVHGEYADVAAKAQAIKDVFYSLGPCSNLSPVQHESLDLIATKLARIFCGDPNYRDHWDDIAGYAILVSDRLSKETT